MMVKVCCNESQSSSLTAEYTGGNGENFHITLDSG